MTQVSGTQVEAMFVSRSRQADAVLRRWQQDPTKQAVVPAVSNHVAAVVHQLTPDDVTRVCEDTQHALGAVARTVAMKSERIRDWHPAFAFSHIFHIVTEQLGHVPTWQDFKRIRGDLDTMLWQPARTEIVAARDVLLSQANRRAAQMDSVSANEVARDAMTWRIGNAYYSFLRELYVLAVLREAGADARVHPLADALFRTDLWVDDTLASLFVGNSFFRDEGGGRKPKSADLLSDAQPPFRFVTIELPVQRKFGVVHLPPRERILSFLPLFS